MLPIRRTLGFAYFLLPYFLLAQHSVGVSVGPTLSYTTQSQPSCTPDQPVDMPPDDAPAGYRLTIQYGYALTPHLQITTGLQYDRRNYRLADTGLRFASQHDGNGGFKPCNPGENLGKNVYYLSDFLGVPVGIRYGIGSKAVRPFLAVSALPSLHLQQQFNFGDGRFPPAQIEDRFHLFGRVATGVTVALGKQVAVLAQVNVERDFTKIEPSVLEERLYGVGLQVGVVKAL